MRPLIIRLQKSRETMQIHKGKRNKLGALFAQLWANGARMPTFLTSLALLKQSGGAKIRRESAVF